MGRLERRRDPVCEWCIQGLPDGHCSCESTNDAARRSFDVLVSFVTSAEASRVAKNEALEAIEKLQAWLLS